MAEETGSQTTTKDDQDDFLSRFLGDLEKLPRTIAEGMLRQTEDEDERMVIRSFATPLENQLSELAGFIRDRGRRVSAQQVQEASRVLRLSSAVTLVESGFGLAANLASPIARIALVEIVQLVKKVIKQLLPALGMSPPGWLNTLLDLIDEVLNHLLSVGSPQLASILSRMERDYLAELTQLSRLQRADKLLSELNGDDEAES
jgi:hypothetical protein